MEQRHCGQLLSQLRLLPILEMENGPTLVTLQVLPKEFPKNISEIIFSLISVAILVL